MERPFAEKQSRRRADRLHARAFGLELTFPLDSINYSSIPRLSSFKVDTMTSGIEAMPTIAASKRLGLDDVNTVFRCLATNQPTPEKLNFKVIRIPHNSLKLSPPSFEYEGENFH